MRTVLMGCALLALVMVMGCGSKASTDQPLDQVQAEASKLSVDDLKAKVEAYKADIAKYQDQLKSLAEQAKKITNPLSDEAKSIASQTSDVTSTINKLQERLKIYADELAKKLQAVTAPATK